MDGRSTALFGFQVLIWVIWFASVPAISQEGFLSIDCGSDETYIDDLGITWETDAKYISTGKNAAVTYPARYVNVINTDQVLTLRYFDEGRGRDCYVLPVKPYYTYLVRPTFFYGTWRNGAGLNNFRVYLNGTLWLELSASGNAQDAAYTYEAIVYSTGSELNFCLVRVSGTPFIAALELRELSVNMYSTVVGRNIFLVLYDREDSGAPLNGPLYLRFPDDAFDRIWYGGGTYLNASFISNNSTSVSTATSTADNLPPVKVMETAWIYYSAGKSFTYYQDFGNPVLNYSLQFIIYGYFQDLDVNASVTDDIRGMELIYNGLVIGSFNMSNHAQQIASQILPVSETYVNISIVAASWSKLNPVVNGFELYFALDFNTSKTALEDVISLLGLQSSYNLTDWRGDPCVPVPYDWISCNSFANTRGPIVRVTQLLLANKSMMAGNSGSGSISPEIANLTALTYLNLSHNGLTTFSTSLKALNTIEIMDFSNNFLGGDVSDFLGAINLGAVQEIHADRNQLEGLFPLDSLVSTNVTYANFDKNNISGTLDLSGWVNAVKQGGTPSRFRLVLSLADNKIVDIYPTLNVLKPTIEGLISSTEASNNAILLGGNPFCTQASSTSLSQKYLCRRTNVALSETSTRSSDKVSRVITIGIPVGAVSVILLVSAICVANAWKLRQRTYALAEIQEALAKQKVHPPFYSFADLREATRNFSSDNKLGEGGFGAVYKGVLADGTVLAIKKLYPPKQAKQTVDNAFTGFLNEVVLITGIRHKNLVQLKGCCVKHDQRFLVYECVENGNLAESLWDAKKGKDMEKQQRIPLDWQTRLNICAGVARGLSYLHEAVQPRIVHRDIKPANILLDKKFDAKIADFGLARPFLEDETRADYTQFAGTLGYLAPEYATLGELTEKADVYSFGVLVLEIVGGRKCIDRTLPVEKMYIVNLVKILRSEGRLLDLLDPAIQKSSNDEEVIRVINIALLCLQVDPSKRPTMSFVVTMLSGGMDVATPGDLPEFYQPDANDHSLVSKSAAGSTSVSSTFSTLGTRKMSETQPLMKKSIPKVNDKHMGKDDPPPNSLEMRHVPSIEAQSEAR